MTSLTLRGKARQLTFVTTHARGDEPLDLDWVKLASKSDATLEIYMGKAAAAQISAQLIAAGLPGSTPVALVENASLPERAGSLQTRLDLLPLAARSALGDGPALLLIGEAMKPRHVLDQASEFSERTDLRLRAHDRKPARQPGIVPIC